MSYKVNSCNFSLEKSLIDGRFDGYRLSLSFWYIFGQGRAKIMTKYLCSRTNYSSLKHYDEDIMSIVDKL